MLKALGLGGGSAVSSKLDGKAAELCNPPLEPRSDFFSISDYGRPMLGAIGYSLIFSAIFTLPLMMTAHPMSILIAMGIAAVMACETMMLIVASAAVHHCTFLHRLKTFGPQYYNTEVGLEAAPAEAFELCLAATSELPRSRIINMDEKNGTIMVALKGNFWITVDRLVTLRVAAPRQNPIVELDNQSSDETKSASGGEDKKVIRSIISIDPSVKLTAPRRKMLRLIWGDKWYALIARSDIKWNRKIIDSVTDYVTSVPNWDHRYEPDEIWLKQAS